MPYKDLEKRAAYLREWNAANREKRAAQKKAWAEANTEKVRETHRRHGQKHRERRLAWTRRHMARLRDVQQAIKTAYGCQNPGCLWQGTVPEYALEFHHVDPAQKDHAVSQVQSMPKLVAEARKCTVLCAICHRMETLGELDASGFQLCDVDDEGRVTSRPSPCPPAEQGTSGRCRR